MKMARRVLSIIMVLVTLISIVSITAEAASVTVEDRNFGYMVPTNSKGTKVLSTVKLYGQYDYINFYINSKFGGEVYFFYEIFSDKNLTKSVERGYVICHNGTYNFSPKITLKGKYKSKTYYAVTYAGMFSSNGKKLIVDENSMCQFKISVDRSPSYKEKMVALKSVTTTVDGPKITWTKISGTSKYYIYRRKIGETKWTKVGSVSGTKNTFTDKKAKTKDGNYIYTVKGIGKNKTNSRYHYAGITILYSEAPVLSTIKVIADNVIYLKWNETSSKAYYTVYRKEVGGKWKTIAKKLSGTSYKDTTAVSGKNYQYTIKATRKSTYGNSESAHYQNSDKKIKYLSAPTLNELNITEEGVAVSWELVKGATSYSILRKPLDSDDAWTVLKEVSAETTAYVDTTASLADGGYLYTVRSEAKGFVGSYDKGKDYLVLSEPEFKISDKDDGVHIEWKKVPYATSYRILEQNEYGNWIIKAKTKKNYYNFYPSSYYNKKITVCACRTGGFLSTYKTDVESTHYFPKITHEVKELDSYTQFTWNGTGADKYRVYRKLKDAPDTDYDLFYESSTAGFSNYNPEEDVAYTYQIRGVYGDIEQNDNLYTKTHIRYAPETCIESFKAYKEVEVFNRRYKGYDEETTCYHFDVEKTDKFKKSTAKFYYWGRVYGGEDWGQTSGYYYVPNYEDAYNLITPARFCCVVSTSSGNSTPLGVNTVYVENETCKVPEITLTPTSKGLKMTWDAVDGAVEYDVFVNFSRRADYKKTIKADGSKTYTINFNDVTYDYNMYLIVSAVHKNGNVTTRHIDDYAFYSRPKLIAAVPDNSSKGVDVFWNTGFDDGCFAVFRKAEGESKWTCISKKYYDYKVCSMNNGVEYTGFVYTDTKAKKGVKYTYTVRRYDSKTKEYISYYDTKGVSVKL